ncbi:MAG: class I SAM-dependent methyltransferase [Bacteroidota bacterium]
MTALALKGVPRTLLVTLGCRALEAGRSDAILSDPRAAQVFKAVGGSPADLMKMSRLDQTFTLMRARQFDRLARSFLTAHAGALVVDLGCGLDTRFERLDDGELSWLGLDLPEVISVRRQFLPDRERCTTLACSMLDLSWLDLVERAGKPAIFLAEGVFPYFTREQVKSVVTELAARFSGGELVFDALSSFSVRLHNRTHPVLGETGVTLKFSVDDPALLEAWGLRLLDRWGYFDEREPRVGLANLVRYIPALNGANFILHYRLGR